MNKVRVIDLLNKIANGEDVPKKINYGGYILTYDEDTQDYYNEPSCTYALLSNLRYKLNDKVEIIEEKKKRLERVLNATVIDVPKLNNIELSKIALKNKEDIKIIKDKLNEIIDRLNGEE